MTVLLTKKFTTYNKRSWLYYLSSIILVLGAIIFVCIPNVVTLIIYNLCFAVGEIILQVNLEIYRNKHLKEEGLYDYIAEHQCILESLLQTSRMISLGTLFLVSVFRNKLVFQLVFIIFILAFSIIGILLSKYEKVNPEHNDNEKTNE